MKQPHTLPQAPTLEQRRQAVLDNLVAARRNPETSVQRYNKLLSLKQKAMYAGAAALVGITASSTLKAMVNAPDIRPATDQRILQPGETIDDIATELCYPKNHVAAVDFILEKSHIAEDRIGSLPAGTLLTIPDNTTC